MIRYNSLTTAVAILLLSACTSTNNENTLQLDAGQFLTADEIRTQIIGNTMVGTATGIKGTLYPYRIYLANGVYKDRIIVQGSPRKASGTYQVTDDGRICTTVRAYRNGKQSCQKYQLRGDQIWVIDVSKDHQLKPHSMKIEPGLTF